MLGKSLYQPGFFLVQRYRHRFAQFGAAQSGKAGRYLQKRRGKIKFLLQFRGHLQTGDYRFALAFFDRSGQFIPGQGLDLAQGQDTKFATNLASKVNMKTAQAFVAVNKIEWWKISGCQEPEATNIQILGLGQPDIWVPKIWHVGL